MEEKSKLCSKKALAEEGGESKEVVIMDPNEVIVGVKDLGDTIREELVRGKEGAVEGAVEG